MAARQHGSLTTWQPETVRAADGQSTTSNITSDLNAYQDNLQSLPLYLVLGQCATDGLHGGALKEGNKLQALQFLPGHPGALIECVVL